MSNWHQRLTDDDYQQLAAFRRALRRYLRWADDRAADVGITPAQHQLLLAIRGRGPDTTPTISELAEELLLRHHSAVGLIDRAEAAELVRRTPDPADQRIVRIGLTERGRDRLDRLAALHLDELGRLAASFPITDSSYT